MRTQQALWTSDRGWQGTMQGAADLILAFGGTKAITDQKLWDTLGERHPKALILGCSTGGEIHDCDVLDESLSVTALGFDQTKIKGAEAAIAAGGSSYDAGRTIGEALASPELSTIFVLSDGTHVNGSELIRGIRSKAGESVVITGGLAGDGPRFGTTYVGLNRMPSAGRIAAVGFYGKNIQVGYGSCGGWDAFGPERKITRSEGNVLFELDGKPALDLYKNYLGEDAANLPGSALLFPLRISPPGRTDESLIRTILNIDEERRAMIFAGDMPEGFSAQLMRGNFDRLVEGAGVAAQQAKKTDSGDRVGILVSCIGRKLLLGQRTYEEVEAVRGVLGPDVPLTGFYSYGEVSPHETTGNAELHNQTMTVTVFSEANC